ncbi:tumor necrosis factor receptor superfamily member 13C [Hippopotamus amphibius kiboko]|uniref:tumor necrosis factor receptor superfamily member 13C n=1 Tax=Hippopotamus amphibius kiboko TaxID=575201 RepID=UPI0025934B68|nr:tumor necrosis factor receptor superfamily member 13C [Hippopotamus amphibius kiboko]
MRRGRRSRRVRDREAPTQCLQTQCFDPLVRRCVACSLLRTTEPRPGGPSSLAPGTALQPQESVGPGAGAEAAAALPLPALLFGAPALLGLALALVLLGLVSWRRRRRRPGATAAPGAPDGDQDAPEPLDNDILSPGTLDTTAPTWLPPSEDPATTPPAHSVPVPATELGSTELVTTKTAGPEQR